MRDQESFHRANRLIFKRMLRRNATPAEKILWEALRNKKLRGMKWRRQANVDVFIADFLCPYYKLIIEVDGGIHDEREVEDRLRANILRNRQYRILRFKNAEVIHNLPSVLERIMQTVFPFPSSTNVERGDTSA